MKDTLEAQLRKALNTGKPILTVLAGSNGAGKSTFYARHLKFTSMRFVNADEIAKILRPDDPGAIAYEAMHAAEALRRDLLEQRQSFCMETVLSDTQGAKLGFFREAQSAGYVLLLIWIRLTNSTLSQARVHHRVSQGGHDVPEDKLIERFPRTEANAIEALQIADFGLVLDNSSLDEPYRLLEIWQAGHRT